jgi:hypothetical protein
MIVDGCGTISGAREEGVAMEFCTDFLYARPSFFEGVARLFDFGNTLNTYNESLSGEYADAWAMWADWGMTGQDIQGAITAYEEAGSVRS